MRDEVSADFECVVALEGTTSTLALSSGNTGERLPAMRVAAVLLMMCVTACGTGPDPKLRELHSQAQLDAQAIMAGMDRARLRAALLAQEPDDADQIDGDHVPREESE